MMTKLNTDLFRPWKRPKKTMQLPCKHGSITIRDKAEDQYIVCPKCMKKYVLTWSLNPKVKWVE